MGVEGLGTVGVHVGVHIGVVLVLLVIVLIVVVKPFVQSDAFFDLYSFVAKHAQIDLLLILLQLHPKRIPPHGPHHIIHNQPPRPISIRRDSQRMPGRFNDEVVVAVA